MLKKKENRYFVTATMTIKLGEGRPAEFVNGREVVKAQHPVLVKLERLQGGSEGYTVERIRQLAMHDNLASRVEALADEDIIKIMDAKTKDPSKGVWTRTDYVRLTRGADAARDHEQLQTLAQEKQALSEKVSSLEDKAASLAKENEMLKSKVKK